MKLLKSLYINHLFYWSLLIVALLAFVSFFVDWLYPVAAGLLIVLLLLLLLDIFVLFSGKNNISAFRVLPEMLSNGDENPIRINVRNNSRIPIYLRIIDEIPHQYQKRDFLIESRIEKFSEKKYQYSLRPVQRGEYLFGRLNIFVLSPLRLAMRRLDRKSVV